MQATVDEILIWYDGPQLVRGTTDDGGMVVAVNLDEDGQCLVACISQETMDGFITNTIEARDVFTTRRIGTYYTSEIVGVGAVMVLRIQDGEPPNDWLPLPGCFLAPT